VKHQVQIIPLTIGGKPHKSLHSAMISPKDEDHGVAEVIEIVTDNIRDTGEGLGV
jgi:hypothetical protein